MLRSRVVQRRRAEAETAGAPSIQLQPAVQLVPRRNVVQGADMEGVARECPVSDPLLACSAAITLSRHLEVTPFGMLGHAYACMCAGYWV